MLKPKLTIKVNSTRLQMFLRHEVFPKRESERETLQNLVDFIERELVHIQLIPKIISFVSEVEESEQVVCVSVL